MWALRQLFAPLAYLRIRQGERFLQSKAVYDLVLPLVLSLLSILLLALLRVPLNLNSHPRTTASLLNLMALLIAFYMAALAAVATFDRKGIDDPLRGSPAILKVLNHETGLKEDKHLSYRQYISYLFGFLSFLSLALYSSLLFVSSAWPRLKALMAGHWTWEIVVTNILSPTIMAVFIFYLWQLLITSLLGIYFLSERIQSLKDHQS